MTVASASPTLQPSAARVNPTPGYASPRLLADIGGTNARFALELGPGHIGHIEVLACAAHATLADAMRAYLALPEVAAAGGVHHAAIAIANPVMGDMVRMTNHHWEFSIEALRRECGFDTFVVVNDFEALAMALPWLQDADKVQVGGGTPAAGAPIGLLGAGTGLGVSGLVPSPDGKSWTALRSEGGHVTFAPANETEVAVLQYAWREFEHVSAERFLSGAGVELIYRALASLRGAAEASLDAPEISRRALAGECALKTSKPSAACSAPWPATWPSRSAPRAGCISAAASCRAWGSVSRAPASAAASSRRAASPATWRPCRPM